MVYISEAGAASVFRLRVKWEETLNLVDTLELRAVTGYRS